MSAHCCSIVLRVLSIILLCKSLALTMIGYGMACQTEQTIIGKSSQTQYIQAQWSIDTWATYARDYSDKYYTLYASVAVQLLALILISCTCCCSPLRSATLAGFTVFFDIIAAALNAWAATYFGDLRYYDHGFSLTCINMSWAAASAGLFLAAALEIADTILLCHRKNRPTPVQPMVMPMQGVPATYAGYPNPDYYNNPPPPYAQGIKPDPNVDSQPHPQDDVIYPEQPTAYYPNNPAAVDQPAV